MTHQSPAAHRSSHRSLLRRGKVVGGSVDAIVVPASRPAAHLLPAMEVAAELGCHFLALCSGRTGLDEAAGLAVEVPDLAWTLVDVRGFRPGELLRFETSAIGPATETRVGDLSLKRNLGLLVAHLARWRRILFLDDDIRDVSPRTVRTAVSDLRTGRATGMVATDFPDNSVVCHAARLAGAPQDVFVSGSALAVDTTEIDSFFPDVYNEDWLFLWDKVRARRVSATGRVRQAPYRPYADPARAAGQEFGDLLAEGLMSLLHIGGDLEPALHPAYWRQAVEQRGLLLDRITVGLGRVDHKDAPAALGAAAAARTSLDRCDPRTLTLFVRKWRQDLVQWRQRVRLLTPASSLGAALDLLELPSQSEGRLIRTGEDRRDQLVGAYGS